MFLPKAFIPYAQEWEAKINAFIELHIERGNIADLPFAADDNIAVKNMSFTCGSKMLENVRSPYSATVVQKLEAMGSAILGKTNCDEFGMGASGNCAFKKTTNPWDSSRTAGSGAAAAVAAGIVPYALGVDAGGTLRQAAAFCGVAGLKPTRGAVSRYGLAAYASSLETIGVLANSINHCRTVFALIHGKDPLDQSSCDPPEPVLPLFHREEQHCTKQIGVLSPQALNEAIDKMLQEAGKTGCSDAFAEAARACLPEDAVQQGFELAKDRFAALGYNLVDITIPHLHYAVPAFYTIAAAEASANLARFDGIRYGLRPDHAENPDAIFDTSRQAGFGPEAKLHIALGTHVLRSGMQERFYLPAQRIRAALQAAFEAILGDSEYRQEAQCDAILMPVFPLRAFTELTPLAYKAASLYTCCASLAGLPALSFPVSIENTASLEDTLPVNVQLVGRAYGEVTLLDIAEMYEQQHPFSRPPGYQAYWS